MSPELQEIKKHPVRIAFLLLAFAGLILVYLFQRIDVWGWICSCTYSPSFHFAFNKSLRLLINDLLMLGVIQMWFYDKSITRLAFWIQLVDTLVLLPVYLILKLTWEGTNEISSPLLSQLHRLIINPTLMILIFPAVYFQRYSVGKQ